MRHTLRIYIDEAGRGPLAGPVYVGLTMPLEHVDTSMFQDSKKLSPTRRAACYTHIQQLEKNTSMFHARGTATAADIDRKGIIASLQKAVHKGLRQLLKKYYSQHRRQALLDSVHGEDTIIVGRFDRLFSTAKGGKQALRELLHTPNSICDIKVLLIDGNHTFGLEKSLDMAVTTIIKGDSKNGHIAAASIIAKEERDAYMIRTHKRYPQWNFAQHKGYGTAAHRKALQEYGGSPLHRYTFCHGIQQSTSGTIPKIAQHSTKITAPEDKPGLLLHICCAPDLTWPLHRLKNHFKLYLFRYNPNIHPRKEHDTRYASFIKLTGLEEGDYEIVEDRYDPKEFFAAMIEEREDIDPKLKHATAKAVLAQAGEMEEWSSRCNPCYSMRLAEAAKNAAKHGVPYFTSTLLISPKKKMDKLMRWGLEGERRHPSTKFLWFDFAKNKGYEKATKLTKGYKLYRQNYCGCGRTIPKPGEENKAYVGG